MASTSRLLSRMRARGRPVVLLMVGPPGSGKSTLAQRLMRTGGERGQQWARVCQDQLGNRAKCERSLQAALAQKQNCIIDRCNFDRKQRGSFCDIAKASSAACVALVLSLPVHLCEQRARERTSHEGGVMGAKAGPVVRRIAGMMRPPVAHGSGLAGCKLSV